MTLIADLFPKLRTQKNLVRSMPKKSPLKGSFEEQHGKCAQTLLKDQGQLLYHIYWSLWGQLTYKKSLLVICKISRLFPNTLNADGKYSLFKGDNFTHPIYMPKTKNFISIFCCIFEIWFKFSTFWKKRMTLIPEVFPKLRTAKKMVTSMSKKSHLKGSFGKLHGKRPQTLLKFPWQHLYHIYWSLWR